ncbi:MAG: hypothetical protein JXB36_16665 [Gammaproteobacteria bacterium]|nr:hypothetical protein [Gammaproteobacteria bacterium]
MTIKARLGACGAAAAALAALAAVAPVEAHHSFSIYDSSVTKVFTGVVTRVNPDANHLQIFFAPMNEERKNVVRDENDKPVVWAVEMTGSAQSAREGISVSTFPPGTIFSVGLHPLRSGEPAGSRVEMGMFKCPERTPPEPGKHCDSVEGHTAFGEGALPSPTE